MNKDIEDRSLTAKILRRIALILTILITVYGALMLIGSAIDDDTPLNLGIIIFVIIMIMTLVGLFAAWKYELIGGWVGIIGAMIMGIDVAITAGHNKLITGLMIGAPFFIAGLLYVISSKISGPFKEE